MFKLANNEDLSSNKSFTIFKIYTAVGFTYCVGFSLVFGRWFYQPVLAAIHVVSAFGLIINYLVLRRTRNFVVGNSVVLVIGHTVIGALFATGGLKQTGEIWAFAYLPYAFYLAGYRRGLYWVSLLYAMLGTEVALHALGVIHLPYSPMILINFCLAYITCTICLVLFQLALAKYAGLAQTQVEEIKAINEDLRQEKGKVEADKAKDEALLASLGDGMIVVDVQGRVLLINTIAREMLGITDGQLLGAKLYERARFHNVQTGRILDEHEVATTAAMKRGARITQIVFCMQPGDKKVVIGMTATPVTSNGRLLGSLAILRDITKEREVDRMKTEFISLASHQLRTPLSAIKWFSEILLSDDAQNLSADQTDYIKNIADSTERMIALVNALLNISRLESGRIIVDPKPTDLRELVEGIFKDLEAKTQEKQQDLIMSVHEDLPKIPLDARLIGQVYLNLLTNAIKYTPQGGEITVFISRKGNYIITQVSDNGYGIPKDQQDRVFQKFFRASNAVKVETDGTGLGLYLVKAIIESSGGKLWFKSEEGKGTTFWFSVPLSGMQPKEGEVTLDV